MIKGVHHTALSVRDLDRAIEFYCNKLGMQCQGQRSFAGGAMDRITGLTGTRGRSAMLRAGAQHIELFEYFAPEPQASLVSKPVCEHGISHFGVEVDDVQETYDRLKAAGVEFHCEPLAFGHMRATYARDPDGNVVERIEIPQPP